MNWIKRFPAEILMVIIAIVFVIQRSPSDRYDRIINADMKAYYGYLPALFIHQDLTWSFVDEYENKYYPEQGEHFKDFTKPVDGGRVNKTYPGLMILLLPFFLLAHGLALAFGLEADGYSMIYQFSVLIATWFYLWAGIRLTIKALDYFKIPYHAALISTFAVVLGTNLFYYSVYDLTISHVFSFFLISGFTVLGYRITHHFERREFYLFIATTCMIFLVRPTNIAVIMLIPFLAGSIDRTKTFFTTIFSSPQNIAGAILIPLTFALIPIVLWYMQTGHYIVYSYGEERFYFDQPHFWSMLISFKKGWWLYTPIAGLAFLGFIHLYRSNKLRAVNLLLFFILMVYVYSCWWIWTFGGGFGQRVFIDYYLFIALLLAFLISSVDGHKLLRPALLVGVVCLLGMNQLQAYQTYKGIFPGGAMTSEIYFERFFQTRLKAEYPVDERLVINRETSTVDEEGITLSKNRNFSSTVSMSIPEGDSVVVRVTAEVNPHDEPIKTNLVIDLKNGEEPIEYKPFFLSDYTSNDSWTTVEFGHPIPDKADNVRVYFWNPGVDETVEIRNVTVEVISLSRGR